MTTATDEPRGIGRWLAAAGIILVLVLTVCAFFYRTRLLENEALYLTQAGRYGEALEVWNRLAARFPGYALHDVKGAKGPAFTLATARQSWRDQPPPAGSTALLDALGLFDRAESMEQLGPAARQARLELLASYNPSATTETLAAARKVLSRDGFDLNALWWLARLAYRPANPLVIPTELRTYADRLRTAPADSPRATQQLTYLRALLALDTLDWAAAAHELGQLQFQPPMHLGLTATDLKELLLAQGLALVRTGRSAEAITAFHQYLESHPGHADALAALVEAHWSLRQVPWAAMAATQLKQSAPARLNALWSGFARSLRVANASLPMLTPELVSALQLATLVQVPLGPDLTLDVLKPRFITDSLTVRKRLDLIELFAWRHDWETARQLALRLVPETEGSTHTLQQSAAAALAWLEAQDGQQAAPTGWVRPRALVESNLLLTEATTQHCKLNVPEGSAFIVIRVQGYAGQNVWPILHAHCGPSASTWYLPESRAETLSLILPVPIASAERQQDLALSLLNASPESGRAVLIATVAVF